MCTWVGGAHVTTGAAWVWVPTHEAKTRWCFRGDRSRRVDGMTGQCGGCGKGALTSTHALPPL